MFLKKNISLYLKACVLLLLSHSAALGQQEPSKPLPEKAEQVQLALSQERIHLQHSQPYYATGERFWYKAFLRSGGGNEKSRVLYVSLLSSTGQILVQQRLIVVEGMAKGDFKLPEKLPSGYYTLIAYTNWMKNYSEPQQYREQLLVVNTQEVLSLQKVSPVNKKYDIHVRFSPEGHSFLAGVPTKIVVSATDAAGMGVVAAGTVQDGAGKKVLDFTTNPSGFGSFTLTAQPGMSYSANVQSDGFKVQRSTLPVAVQQGISMAVAEQSKESIKVQIKGTPATRYTLVAESEGKVFFTHVPTAPAAAEDITVPWSNTGGLVRLLLIDNWGQVKAERVVGAVQKSSVMVKADKEKYSPRQEVSVTLQAFEEKGHPALANLSVTVLPASLAAGGKVKYKPATSDEALISLPPDTALWRTIYVGGATQAFARESIAIPLGQKIEQYDLKGTKFNTDTAFVQALPREIWEYAQKHYARTRVEGAYGLTEPHALATLPKLPADKVFKLDDYVDFESVEEAVREATSNVKLTKKRGSYKINLLFTSMQEKYIFKKEPLYIIDGVVVNSADEIFRLNLKDLASFEIAWSERKLNESNLGEMASNGIFAVYTKSGEARERLQNKGGEVLYGRFNLAQSFVVTSYEGEAAIPAYVPDLKALVFWEPDIQTDTKGNALLHFKMPDNVGDFEIRVRGITANGTLAEGTASITSELIK